MICPNCQSIATHILTNTDFYTCLECKTQFGHLTGSLKNCPNCLSTDILDNDPWECKRCGTLFENIPDQKIHFPSSIIFSSYIRGKQEFFQWRMLENN